MTGSYWLQICVLFTHGFLAVWAVYLKQFNQIEHGHLCPHNTWDFVSEFQELVCLALFLKCHLKHKQVTHQSVHLTQNLGWVKMKVSGSYLPVYLYVCMCGSLVSVWASSGAMAVNQCIMCHYWKHFFILPLLIPAKPVFLQGYIKFKLFQRQQNGNYS